MNKRLSWLSIASAMLLAGCGGGGGGGGLGVTGGSIPTGTIIGHLVLPDGQPLTSAAVTATALPSTPVPGATSTVNTDGSFSVANVPTGKNIELAFTQSSVTLKVVVPKDQLQGNQSADVGQVNALTTVVARSVEKETKNTDSANLDLIVSDQTDQLLSEVTAQGQSQSQQQLEITDPNALDASANATIAGTVNSELAAMAADQKHHEVDTALDGLAGQIAASGGAAVNLAPRQREALILAQTQSVIYTPAQIVSALKAAGAPTATASGVTAADAAQRSLFPAWNSVNAAITPIEALSIAASPASASGYGLSSAQTAQFLTSLGIT